MKLYRYFYLFSLCCHVFLIAYLDTFIVSSTARPPLPPLKVTIFEKAIPLPMGDSATPGAGGQIALEPKPKQVVDKRQQKKELPKKKPKPAPKKASKKQTPKPKPLVAKAAPKEEPLQTPAFSKALDMETEKENGLSDRDGVQTALAERNGGSGTDPGRDGQGGGSGRGSSGSGGSLAKPAYGVNPKPAYPYIARRMGIQGVVLLRILVRADGSVAEAEVKESSGSSALDSSALITVRDQWRFVPARLDGTPVESWVEVPIRFVLATG